MSENYETGDGDTNNPYTSDSLTYQDYDVTPPPAEHEAQTNKKPQTEDDKQTPPVLPKRRGWHITRKQIFIVALILLLLSGSIDTFIYITRSTPDKTLDTFCTALVQHNYQNAYQQFAPQLQHDFSPQIFSSTLNSNKVIKCTYTPVAEAAASVQTDLTLLHGSAGSNHDQVTLAKDKQSVWRITNLSVSKPTHVSQQAAIHHLTLATNQTISRLAMVFATNSSNAGLSLAVAAGARVVIFASGTITMTSSGEQVGADGTTSCSMAARPAPALNCAALIYGLGAPDQINKAGTHADFTVQTNDVLFFGLNMPYQSQAQGSLQLTILTIPPGTATALWQQSVHNTFFFSPQQGHGSLSVEIFTQHFAGRTASVLFYLVNHGTEIPICQVPYNGAATSVSCKWNMRVNDRHMGLQSSTNGTLVSDGPITIGFSLQVSGGTNMPEVVDNPDGTRNGVIRSITTQQNYNYAGYAVQNMPYDNTTTSWTIPAVHCGSGENSEVAIWAGISTPDTSHIAQIAGISSCLSGSQFYYVVWEMYPAPPHLIYRPIQPGDQMVATVIYQQGHFQLTLKNMSEDWSFTTTQADSQNNRLAAECIVEAPTSPDTNQLDSLSNFGSVSVSCQVNGQAIGVTGPQIYAYQMAGPQQHATTSDLDQQGANFTVRWQSS